MLLTFYFLFLLYIFDIFIFKRFFTQDPALEPISIFLVYRKHTSRATSLGK